MKICPGCARIVEPSTHACEQLRARAATDNARRHVRQRVHGRDTRRWRRLRQLVLDRDLYSCTLQLAGCTRLATTVHLDPALAGDHHDASIDDCTSACAHCHAVADAPRATATATA